MKGEYEALPDEVFWLLIQGNIFVYCALLKYYCAIEPLRYNKCNISGGGDACDKT